MKEAGIQWAADLSVRAWSKRPTNAPGGQNGGGRGRRVNKMATPMPHRLAIKTKAPRCQGVKVAPAADEAIVLK